MSGNSDLNAVRAISLILSNQSLSIRNYIQNEVKLGSSLELALLERVLPELEINKAFESALLKIKAWKDSNYNLVSFFEEEYPLALKNLVDAPMLLFSKGHSISSIDKYVSVAIVGSRRADPEGLELARHFALELAKLGVVIVSGLALGIDGAAHRGALEAGNGLCTLAVLGSGIDLIYPPKHRELYKDILSAQKGSILSQFEPGTPPYPANFINRNRVVSGLSKAVLVVQATLKSGSLVTAKYALEQGKDVLVVPGNIDNLRYEGSNKIIQQGASLVTSVADVLEILGIDPSEQRPKPELKIELSSRIEKSIIETVEKIGEIKVDQLLRELATTTLERELVELEMKGVIQRMPGNFIRLKRK